MKASAWRASAWEFRHRFWVIMGIYTLGFTTPWDAVLHLDGRGIGGGVWGWLAVALEKTTGMGIGRAFDAVLVAAIVLAGLGAWLRMWGTAYLGADVMRDGAMRGDGVTAEGPYRYLRNPLYVGSWLNALALALLMRPSGAVFTVVALVGFEVRLVLGEEAFLREKLGAGYAEYCAAVGRFWPRWGVRGGRTAGDGGRPRWGRAAAAEVFMWGSALSFAVLGWRYDTVLLLQCVLVWLGVSLVVRGLGLGEAARG